MAKTKAFWIVWVVALGKQKKHASKNASAKWRKSSFVWRPNVRLRKAPLVDPPLGMWDSFCARFPYQETDDQLNAISDVIEDLGTGQPMDRLICGDVGFGKTEVAMRAAFVAACNGLQVAVVAPTTLLARQTC